MPNTKFDAKSFNAEAFKYAVDRIPRTRLNEMRKSKVLTGNPDIREVFASQNGTGYARIAMRGLLDGDAVNYDGQTDITATSTKTFEQGVVVIGRAKGWVEKDFSFDITGGIDFMDNVAAQVADYWQDVDQDTLIAVLKGVFSMTSTKGAQFVSKHTFTVDGNMEPSTLNSATAKACGDHKKKFAMIFMHSVVATNLENLNLLTALKYTDKDGITRDLTLYTWNGKLVVVDDGMPVAAVETTYKKTTDTALDASKTYYTKGEVFQSNQTMRVCDQIANDMAVLFNTRYVGVVPNDAAGRASLWGDAVKLIQELEKIRAVENFDPDTVTCEQGDKKKAVLLTVNGLNVINAMAQLYMSVIIQ